MLLWIAIPMSQNRMRIHLTINLSATTIAGVGEEEHYHHPYRGGPPLCYRLINFLILADTFPGCVVVVVVVLVPGVKSANPAKSPNGFF